MIEGQTFNQNEYLHDLELIKKNSIAFAKAGVKKYSIL